MVKFFTVWRIKGEGRVVVTSWNSDNVAIPNTELSTITCLQHLVCCDFYVSKARKHIFFRAWKPRWHNDKFVYRERHSRKAFSSCKGNTRNYLNWLLWHYSQVCLCSLCWRWSVWLFKSSFKTLSSRLTKQVSRCLQFPLFMIGCEGKWWKCLMGCLWLRTMSLCVLLLLFFFLWRWKLAFEFYMKRKASQSIFIEKHRSSTLLYKTFRMFSTPWRSTHGLFQKETWNKYAKAMKSLDGYFSAQINIPFER